MIKKLIQWVKDRNKRKTDRYVDNDLRIQNEIQKINRNQTIEQHKRHY